MIPLSINKSENIISMIVVKTFTNWLVKTSPAMGCLLSEVLPNSALVRNQSDLPQFGWMQYSIYVSCISCLSFSFSSPCITLLQHVDHERLVHLMELSHINLIFKEFGFFMATKVLFGNSTFRNFRRSGA